MKKTLLTLSIAAVFAVGASAAEFKAGTYTAKAPGIHGDVTVTVTFTKDKIADVKVTHSETPGIGSKAAELLPGRIVERQSPQVDGVTGATMSATIRTRMNGLNVVLVEKMPFIGGAASISGGQVVAQGSKLQKAFGVTDDSVESMVKDFQANGHNLNDLSKLTLYAKNVGPTIDWLHDQVGVKFIPNDLPFLAEYSHRRALEFQGGAGTMAQHLREVIGSNGAKVLFNTRVEKLIVEDGKVTGVEAVDGNTGTKYTIRAKKTLLTTGGYGNNKNLLTDTYKNTLYYGPVSSTGDGLQMAQKLGVKTQLLEYGKRYPNGIEVAPGKAKSTIYANVGAFDQAGILVSRDGLRFVNEKASNRHILDPMLQQKGGMAYVFMDQ